MQAQQTPPPPQPPPGPSHMAAGPHACRWLYMDAGSTQAHACAGPSGSTGTAGDQGKKGWAVGRKLETCGGRLWPCTWESQPLLPLLACVHHTLVR